MPTAASARRPTSLLEWLSRILMVLILAVIAVFIGLRYQPLLKQDQEMRADLERQEAEVQRLKTEVNRLENEVRSLRSDPKVVERRLRELGYSRPEDVVVTFTDKRR